MRIGLTSFAYRWHIHEGMAVLRLIEEAASLKAEVIQIAENVPLDSLSLIEMKDLGGYAKSLGLVVELGVADPASAEWIRHLERCRAFGARILRAIIDGKNGYVDPAAAAAGLGALVPVLQETGITLCVENHFRFTPAELIGIMKKVDSPFVAVCLDPLNAITRLVGPDEAAASLLPYARTAHIKNVRLERPRIGFNFTGCPLGEGLFDAAGFLKRIKSRVASALYECWMDPLDTVTSTLEQEKLWARAGMDFLRSNR
jgi:sugar phosphate isomerase/epimerase